MWGENWEGPAVIPGPRGDVTADLERERDLLVARFLQQDVLDREDVVADIRRMVERERTFADAYGDNFTTDDYVRAVLGHTAIYLRGRHAER